MDEFLQGYKLESSRFYYDYSDGLAIVIDSATGMYYGMNGLGSAVFDQLAKGSSPEAILEQLRQIPVCSLEIESMFRRFFSQLKDFGLLIVDEYQGKSAYPFEEALLEKGCQLEIKEFAEVQEILLADPIHDVHSDFGWPILKS